MNTGSHLSLQMTLKKHLGLGIGVKDVCAWMAENGGLAVVTDFDGCLTQKYTDGTVISIMEIVRSYLERDHQSTYRQYQEVLVRVRAVRSDQHLSCKQKQQMLTECWQEIMTLLCHCPVITPDFLDAVADVHSIQIRYDMVEWLQHLGKIGATLVIYSACALGLNMIPLLLAKAEIDLEDRIRVISNGLSWTSNGVNRHIMSTSLVTPVNKNADQVLAAMESCPAHVLLIGDQPADLKAVKGLPCLFQCTLGIAANKEVSYFSRLFDVAIRADARWDQLWAV